MNNNQFNSLNVMVVDDQRTMRSIIRSLLKQIEITQISEAPNGFEALRLLDSSKQPLDVVITDLHMDKMDGLELCQKIRMSKNPNLHDTKVLILTGEEDEMIHEVSEQVGAFAIMQKPINPSQLKDNIGAAVGFLV